MIQTGTDLREVMKRIDTMDRNELALTLRMVVDEYLEYRAVVSENNRISAYMAKEYQDLKEDLELKEAQVAALLSENQKLLNQLQLRSNDLFGRSTEKLDDLLGSGFGGDMAEDPLSEDADTYVSSEENASDHAADDENGQAASDNNADKTHSHKYGKRTKGRRKKDLANLPAKIERIFEPAKYDIEYGEGNWMIVRWIKDVTVERIPSMLYKKIVYRPVIKLPSQKAMITVASPYRNFLPGSIVSESLLAGIIYDRTVLALPTYRQEQEFKRNGAIIRRNTMTRWINDVAAPLYYAVYEYMAVLIREDAYNQCDETITQVIDDGRSAGCKCYVWVHTTGELSDSPQIILFCFELTRGTDHLRDFYEETGYNGTVTSDAYQAYPLLEKETDGEVTITGCFMHCRRKFSEALRVLKLPDLCETDLNELPEIKAQRMIAEIYEAETPLKKVSADERARKRDQKVRPLVNDFFDYVHGLQLDDPGISERLKIAVKYTLNQEKYLTRFLDDPNIPIDNGYVERHIRPYAVGRGSWKFNYSITGAEANTINYTLVETAKANGAHPFYYLKYLLERMPANMDRSCKERAYLEDMMPWSEEYRRYESDELKKNTAFMENREQCNPDSDTRTYSRPSDNISPAA